MIPLRNKLDRLEDAMHAADIAWWEIEFPSGTVFFSENKTKMLGYTYENFFHYSHFTDLVHPEDLPAAMTSMTNLITGKSDVYETTYRILAKDGSYKTFYDKGRIVSQIDDEFVVSGIVMEVQPAASA
jgi:PAS domain S-box-containing protein